MLLTPGVTFSTVITEVPLITSPVKFLPSTVTVTFPVALSPMMTTTVLFAWSITMISVSIGDTLNTVEFSLGSYLADPSNATPASYVATLRAGMTNVPCPSETDTVYFSLSTVTVTFPYKSAGVEISITSLSPTVMFSAVMITNEGTLDTMKLLLAFASLYLSSPMYAAVIL